MVKLIASVTVDLLSLFVSVLQAVEFMMCMQASWQQLQCRVFAKVLCKQKHDKIELKTVMMFCSFVSLHMLKQTITSCDRFKIAMLNR